MEVYHANDMMTFINDLQLLHSFLQLVMSTENPETENDQHSSVLAADIIENPH